MGRKRRVRVYHMQVQIPYDVCDHYIYEKCTNKINLKLRLEKVHI